MNVVHVPPPERRSPSVAAVLRHRWQGTYEIDPWGLDPELVSLFAPAVGLRWRLIVEGADALPAAGPAVLVFSRRVGWSEPAVLVAALQRATGRTVRVVGCPDVAPVGTVLRRFGAVMADPHEVAGLLRAGELVAVPAERRPLRGGQAGAAPVDLLAPAEALGAPVHPVAVRGRELGLHWRVTVGDALPEVAGGAALADAALADHARRGLQDLLDAG